MIEENHFKIVVIEHNLGFDRIVLIVMSWFLSGNRLSTNNSNKQKNVNGVVFVTGVEVDEKSHTFFLDYNHNQHFMFG